MYNLHERGNNDFFLYKMTYIIQTFVFQEWQDERLVWNPEEHNNLTEVIIESRSLWRPEFAVING